MVFTHVDVNCANSNTADGHVQLDKNTLAFILNLYLVLGLSGKSLAEFAKFVAVVP